MSLTTLADLQPQIQQLSRDLSDFNSSVNGSQSTVVTVTSGLQIPSMANVILNFKSQAEALIAHINQIVGGINTDPNAVRFDTAEVPITSSNVGSNLVIVISNFVSVIEVSLNGLEQEKSSYSVDVAAKTVTVFKNQVGYSVGDEVSITYFGSSS